MAEALSAFNLQQWIEDNKPAFSGPVANKEVFPQSELIFQIIRGPNARNDFHIDPGDEIFYQLQGTIRVDVVEDGRRKQNVVHQGDVLLVPAGVPHSPLRPAGSWGLVVERKRRPDELDGILWFCEQCNAKLYERGFHLHDIGADIREAVDDFFASEEHRTCGSCGAVLAVPSEFAL
ncbi:MAG TPA: 3-hydroxyanthranilate 3,4-dioxygenase [Chloroflexota bacterium]|nr:3-hydroxyanthranilate 3,4-dioxygenase [Chloroflexota bacterium]